jgi:serine beta-lactamase-like protein LACTB
LMMAVSQLLAIVASAAGLSETQTARITTAISHFMVNTHAPGVSVSIARSGEIVFEQGYGLSDVEHDSPAKTQTIYRLASVSKPVTSIAVMQLVEKGKISLDASIADYVKSLPAAYEHVTIRDLLRHTGGVRHYKGDQEYKNNRHCDHLEQALDEFSRDPLEHEPGAKMTYSTHGFILLGLAVESASGLQFSDYLQQFVFHPAGMAQTLVDDPQPIVLERSRGYGRSRSGALRNADAVDNTCKIPGGGLLSTAGDLSRLYLALESGKLLKSATVTLMMHNQLPPKVLQILKDTLGAKMYAGFGYGFGWIIATKHRPDAVWHGGVGSGATTALYLLPHDRVGVAILANIEEQGDAITELVDDVGEIVTDKSL